MLKVATLFSGVVALFISPILAFSTKVKMKIQKINKLRF